MRIARIAVASLAAIGLSVAVDAAEIDPLGEAPPVGSVHLVQVFGEICFGSEDGTVETRVARAEKLGFSDGGGDLPNIYLALGGRVALTVETNPFSQKHTNCFLKAEMQDVLAVGTVEGDVDVMLSERAPGLIKGDRTGQTIGWDGKFNGRDTAVRYTATNTFFDLRAVIAE